MPLSRKPPAKRARKRGGGSRSITKNRHQIPFNLPAELKGRFLAYAENVNGGQQGALREAVQLLLDRRPGLVLPPALAIDLQAFCEAHFEAKQERVVAEALTRFIHEELAAEPARFKERFAEAKRKIEGTTRPGIRLIRGAKP